MKTNLEHIFFGRQTKLELLKKRVLNLKEGYRQNIAFVGGRTIGKTSILKRFLADLDDDSVVSVYVDLERKDLRHFFLKFAGSILYHYSRTHHLCLHDDFKVLMESTQKAIPNTVGSIKNIEALLKKEKYSDAYQEIISLPDVFIAETGCFCVIVLDEFHQMEDFFAADVFQKLGKKIMAQKRCLYVLASSAPEVAKKILSEKLSLLFGNFEIIPVASFELRTSQAFIEYHLENVNIGVQFKNFLTDFSGGHPLYLNLLCQEIRRLSAIHEQKWVFLPLIIQAIENTLFHQWGVLNRHFELMIDQLCQLHGDNAMSSVLLALAHGRHKLGEIVKETHIKQAIVTKKLDALMSAGLIVKNGTFYLLEDRLLKYWIRFVFGKRLRAIDPSEEKMRAEFSEELNRSLSYFHQISREELSSRIVDLFEAFDNEALSINGRKYKLPAFEEIIPIKLKDAQGRYFDVIKASCDEGIWLIVPKSDLLSENDLNSFLTEIKKLEQKPLRRVIISLSDMEANARLKALQERVWIWNEHELNSLLNIYNKPFIMR